MPPGCAALEYGADPGHQPVRTGPNGSRIPDLQPQQSPRPGPLKGPEPSAAGEPGGQDRNPEEGDEEPGAEGDGGDGEGEEDDADRQAEQEVPELPPGPPFERRAQHGGNEVFTALGSVFRGHLGRPFCDAGCHGPRVVRGRGGHHEGGSRVGRGFSPPWGGADYVAGRPVLWGAGSSRRGGRLGGRSVGCGSWGAAGRLRGCLEGAGSSRRGGVCSGCLWGAGSGAAPQGRLLGVGGAVRCFVLVTRCRPPITCGDDLHSPSRAGGFAVQIRQVAPPAGGNRQRRLARATTGPEPGPHVPPREGPAAGRPPPVRGAAAGNRGRA